MAFTGIRRIQLIPQQKQWKPEGNGMTCQSTAWNEVNGLRYKGTPSENNSSKVRAKWHFDKKPVVSKPLVFSYPHFLKLPLPMKHHPSGHTPRNLGAM